MSARDDFLPRFLAAQPSLHAFVHAACGDWHAAEDVAQETALAAWRDVERYDASRPFAAWLIGIARHKLADRARRHRLAPLPDDACELLGAAALADAGGDARRARLRACLDRLAPPARELVALRYEHDLDVAGIAARLGRSFEAVKKALVRARAALADCAGAAT